MTTSDARRLSDVEIEDALVRLLGEHPDCQVAAVQPSGHFCPMPPGVPITTQEELHARTGLDLVDPSSRQTVLDQFTRAHEEGACEAVLTLAGGGSVTGYLLDVRNRWGVFVLLWVVHVGGKTIGEANLPAPEPVVPRYGRMWRNEIAEAFRVDTSACRMLGYSEKELLTIETVQFLHPEEHRAALDQWLDIIGSAPGSVRRARGRRRRSDGTWMWIESTTTNHLDDPDEPHILTEMVDISEEMAAADEVWRSRELLSRITEALPLGIVQIDTDQTVVYTNDRLLQIVGTTRCQTLHEQLALVLDDDRESLDAGLAMALSHGRDGDFEVRLADGREPGVRSLQLAVRALRGRSEEITGAVICVSDVTDSTRMRKELEQRASFDPLTQCFNRATLMHHAERAVAMPEPGLAVVFVDLDKFKPINDELGHAAGDELLQAVAGALRPLIRANDLLGRFGGDEFVVLLTDVPDRQQALAIAHRAARALHFDAEVGGRLIPVRASIGVAWTDARGVSAEALVAAADAAMYEAKRAGDLRPVLADDPKPAHA